MRLLRWGSMLEVEGKAMKKRALRLGVVVRVAGPVAILLACAGMGLAAEKDAGRVSFSEYNAARKGVPEAEWTPEQWKMYVDGWSAPTHRHTPLNEAAYKGRLDRVRVLVERGADLKRRAHITDRGGITYWSAGDAQDLQQGVSGAPLLAAVVGGHLDVVEYLLEKGADPNLGNRFRAVDATPLHHAVNMGRVDIVDCLLKHGAEVDRVAQGLGTPLHLAARDGHFDAAKRLIEAGADVRAEFKPYPKESFGQWGIGEPHDLHTPADFARKRGHVELAALLERAEAKREQGRPR